MKKIIVLCLVLALSLSVLGGCNTGNKSGTNDNDGTTTEIIL